MAKRLKTYRIDGDLDDAVTAKAAREGETVTDVITRAFREYVKGEPPQRVHGIKIITDERMPPGTAALVSRGRDGVQVSAFSLGAEEPGPQQDTGPCTHPKKDRLKGRCARCRTFVGYD
jgi:hypothetical protein